MIFVVIPVFNEEKSIEKVIKSVYPFCDKLIVVDDCSTDTTLKILKSQKNDKLIILENNKNLGIGGASKIGFRKAFSLGAKYIVKFDGDGQHLAEDIPKFIEQLSENDFDYVKGNRFMSSISEMPFYKLIGNLISTTLQKIVTGNFSISDPNNGFLAFKVGIFEKINLKNLRNDYFFENSILVNLNVFKYKISEVPIETIYAGEKSSIPLFSGSLKLIPVFTKLLYLKNYLNIRANLSMGSLIFFIINFLIILKIIFIEVISLSLIFGLIVVYLLIEVINFFNE